MFSWLRSRQEAASREASAPFSALQSHPFIDEELADALRLHGDIPPQLFNGSPLHRAIREIIRARDIKIAVMEGELAAHRREATHESVAFHQSPIFSPPIIPHLTLFDPDGKIGADVRHRSATDD